MVKIGKLVLKSVWKDIFFENIFFYLSWNFTAKSKKSCNLENFTNFPGEEVNIKNVLTF